LSEIAEKAEKAERDSMLLLPSETPSQMSVATRSESHRELVKSSGPTLGQIDAYAAGLSGGDDRTMILRKTTPWVAQLYEQWTTLSANNTEEESSFDAAAVAVLVDMEDANVSQETPHQAREIPQTDNPMDKSGSQQAEMTITVENKPHNKAGRSQNCDCIRAKMERPDYLDELDRINGWLEAWLDSCQAGRKLPNTCEEFLQKSARRYELDHEYVAHYMWPLYREYRARLSDLVSITDSEIADLCCQKEEALAKTDLKRSNRIEAFELPRLLKRRLRLLNKYGYPFDRIKVVDGFFVIEPSSCEIANREPSAKEAKAATAKLRDQDQRRDRWGLNRHAYVEDDSSSDSDTATHARAAALRSPRMETMRSPSRTSPSSSIRQEELKRPSEGSRRHSYDNDDDVEEYLAKSSPRTNMTSAEPKRSFERSHKYDDNDDDDDEYINPWEERHKGAAEYVASFKRSGSDSDRRADIDEAKVQPLPIPTHNSSPANLRSDRRADIDEAKVRPPLMPTHNSSQLIFAPT
jgi:hypothetical protein